MKRREVLGKGLAIMVSCAGLLLIAAFHDVWAQQQAPKLALKITATKEVKALREGKWALDYVPVEKTGKGDRLLYTIAYTNEGSSPATDATIIDPVPPGTVYVLDSALGESAEVACSMDGGKTFRKPPLKQMVRRPDGKEEEKLVPPEMYTHIRWTIRRTVLPGKGGTVFFKTTVR